MTVSPRSRLSAWLDRHPETATDALQVVKTVVATVAAWWIAVHLLPSELSFLAPWTALLTVHTTVYATVRRGVQTMAATALGILVAVAVATPLGVSVWSLGLATLVGLIAARLRPLREEGLAVATTALFMLAGHDHSNVDLMADRVAEVCLGVTVGLVVNALVAPPLRRRQAERYVEEIHRRMGELLVGMADELEDTWDVDHARKWVDRTDRMDELLGAAWGQIRLSRESERWNPRRATSTKKAATVDDGPAATLTRLHEGVAHLRHLVRTLDEATLTDTRWDARFRTRWVSVARECGRRLADPDIEPTEPADALDRLTDEMSRTDLPRLHWPLYGALITSLRHISRIADDVAGTPAPRSEE